MPISLRQSLTKIINTQKQLKQFVYYGDLTLVFCKCAINRVGGWVTMYCCMCTSRIGRHRNSLEWCALIVDLCTSRHQYLISHLCLFVKKISYFKNLYVFESWWIQTTSLCVFVYKSSDKIHISLFLQTLKLCDKKFI